MPPNWTFKNESICLYNHGRIRDRDQIVVGKLGYLITLCKTCDGQQDTASELRLSTTVLPQPVYIRAPGLVIKNASALASLSRSLRCLHF